jgi:hypothetical protein
LNFASQVPGFGCIANRDAELFQVDGFSDEIVGAAAQGRDGVTDLNIARDHDHYRFGMFTLDLTQYVETGTIRQIDIEQNYGGQVRLEVLYSFGN